MALDSEISGAFRGRSPRRRSRRDRARVRIDFLRLRFFRGRSTELACLRFFAYLPPLAGGGVGRETRSRAAPKTISPFYLRPCSCRTREYRGYPVPGSSPVDVRLGMLARNLALMSKATSVLRARFLRVSRRSSARPDLSLSLSRIVKRNRRCSRSRFLSAGSSASHERV